MANPFTVMVSNLQQLGFFGFLLPWLFMFAVVFALLLKSKALGEDKKISGVISLVIAFFVVGFGGPALGNFFIDLFGAAAVVLAGILVIILFVALTGGDISKLGSNKATLAVVIGIGIIIFATLIGTAFGVRVNWEVGAIIFMIIVMAIAVYFIGGNS
ncbi:MAG TPA: hypothetical protein VJB11_02180 [archaeon]|nr:hypothetical protein [archaeon]